MKKFKKVMCAFVLATVFFIGDAFAAVAVAERQALIDLYNSINGAKK